MRPAGIYKSHGLMTYISRSANSDFGQFSMVKISVIGRFLSSADMLLDFTFGPLRST